MWIPVFKGTKTVLLGYEESFLKCPSCETTTLAEVVVASRYFYVYWIPICPTGKEANIKCTKCGMRRSEVPIEKGSIINKADLQNRYRHPWYTYIGVGFGIFILLLPFIARWIRTGDISKI